MSDKSAPRCAALVGPYLTGKTTLLEGMLFITGGIGRKGTLKEGNTVGDSAQEARDRGMSTEMTAASMEYLGDSWTILDCPGSVELLQESYNALAVVDAAVIVCEPDISKAKILAPLFKFFDDNAIPHMVFVNKVDHLGQTRIADVMQALQEVSPRPLVLRQVPIIDGDDINGYVDLVSERAYRYKPGAGSELIQIPAEIQDEEGSARQEMLESLSDYDDALLEQLLEESVPPTEDIYDHLTKNLQQDNIVPVFIGAAEQEHGIRRLLKALRHEVPQPTVTAERLGVDNSGGATARVFKTYHMPHSGKLSLARVWHGEISDGDTFGNDRVSGLFRMTGHHQDKIAKAGVGDVVALGRMDEVRTGDLLSASGGRSGAGWPAPMTPLYSFAIEAEKRDDEVKLPGALGRLNEEDPSFTREQNADTNELLIWGQGEIHLQIALDRLKNKYNLAASHRRPQVAYKETIRKPVSQHARFKRQSGGHGQFGDVHIDIKPLPRGAGFEFQDTVTGGSVPKQYIPSVGVGVKEYTGRGPLGFPVVDLMVTLTDGQFHAVDSSDQAFKTAGRLAMTEGMPKCGPVLLEPIFLVKLLVPSEFTAKVHGLISGRRGQILGFEAKEGWDGWDEVNANMPQSEIHDLIVELRSLTLGVGTFSWEFDHLQELTGRIADQVVEERASALAAD